MISKILKLLVSKTAYAHCDIPCGIYDPHQMQLAAHTVIRMTQLLQDIKQDDDTKSDHDIARIVHVKEEHGEMLEKEIGTLDNDYFKPEHHEKFPELAALLDKTVKASIKARQNIDMEAAKGALDGALQIAEIFYKTKGVTPIRVKSVYPTEGEIVLYK